MRNNHARVAVAVILGLAAASAIAQTPIVYPAKNQTPQQQQKDEGECAAWAKQTTGVDPVVLASTPAPVAAPTAAPPPPPSGPSGQRVRGAARGAAAGAVVGEIADDDASEGAKYGAAVGAVAGGSNARRDRRNQEEQVSQQQQQAAAQQQQAVAQAEAKKQEQLSTYNRANAACLEGRGYTLRRRRIHGAGGIREINRIFEVTDRHRVLHRESSSIPLARAIPGTCRRGPNGDRDRGGVRRRTSRPGRRP